MRGTQGYKPPDAAPSEYQTIPLNKIEDFGVHSDRYYPLDISYFKSSLDSYMLDLLWNKYWVNTLSSSPLLGTRDLRTGQIADIGAQCDSPPLVARLVGSSMRHQHLSLHKLAWLPAASLQYKRYACCGDCCSSASDCCCGCCSAMHACCSLDLGRLLLHVAVKTNCCMSCFASILDLPFLLS